MKTENETLNPEQTDALDLLNSGENVFLSGGAGSGKSYVVRRFQDVASKKSFPVLASTGAAAVLIGGRTFHSYFGLGIMEGGVTQTVERALKQKNLKRRLSEAEGIIIDEVSMIPASALEAAEEIARLSRESSLPWGGLRVIAVGDFFQLPPVVNQFGQSAARPWCFKSPTWEKTGFMSKILCHNHRVSDDTFLDVLSEVRQGRVSSKVRSYLNGQMLENQFDDDAIRLFPRRNQASEFNVHQLSKIDREPVNIDTIFIGEDRFIETFKKNCPIPERLTLKTGCRVMFLQNDPQKRWVNGTVGEVVSVSQTEVQVKKLRGREVKVDKTMFSYLNADGEIVASAINFPLTLAYATTIHKAQGATLDQLWTDLRGLWEPGHAYVAISRLREGTGLRLLSWSDRSFIVDPEVIQFYQLLGHS